MTHSSAPPVFQSLTRRAATAGATHLGLRIAEEPALRDQIRAQQIDLLFKNVAIGVVGAGLSALVLTASMHAQGSVSALRGMSWAAYIGLGMCLHLALLVSYGRSGGARVSWRRWAAAFTFISFLEGMGWGWAPLSLVERGHDDVRLLVACLAMSVAAGAAPAFGHYMPAFFALFLPATFPMAVAFDFEDAPVLRLAGHMMPIFIVAVVVLAIQASSKYRELVALRLTSTALAEKLRSQVEFVEQAMIAKSQFLAAASHDLRQPVHAIALFAGALRGQPMPEAAQNLAGQIEDAVGALDGLFVALLDISRLDAGSVEVRPNEFALTPLFLRLVEDFRLEASAKSLRIGCVGGAARVRADPVLLERILRNLVSNAVRYTAQGRVLIGCRRRGDFAEIQIHDTGAGIAPEHQPLIFREYFQIENPERDRRKGLGLGLAIVDRLVRLQGFALRVRSRLGRGSSFTLEIPLAPGRPERSLAPNVEDVRGSGVIVVVDDEAPILAGMKALLQGWGYDVVAADSGAAAVAALARHTRRPDLLITDHWLRDGETGFDVIERLNTEYNADLPALIVSGDTGRAMKLQAEAMGATILHKPTPPARLRSAVVASLGRAGATLP